MASREIVKSSLSGWALRQSQLTRRIAKGVMRSTIRPLWASSLPMSVQRQTTEALLRYGVLPKDVRIEERVALSAQSSCERITPTQPVSSRVVFFVHGGGYVVCSPRTHRPLTTRMAQLLNAVTYVPYYRLAPENPFPAGLEDVIAAYQAVLAQGVAADNIVLMGDSAGGGMAMALALSLRDRGLPMPNKMVLISPWTDLTLSGQSLRDKAAVDPMLTWKWIIAKTPLYVGQHDAKNPLLSPLWADLRGLPPTLVQVGSEEILLSDSERLYERANQAGWDCHLQVWQDMWHDFQMLSPMLPEATSALAVIQRFVQSSATEKHKSEQKK